MSRMQASWGQSATVGLLFLILSFVPGLSANLPKGLYAVVSMNSQNCIGDGSAAMAAGDPVAQTACAQGAGAEQEWTLNPVGTATPQQYQLINNASGLCLDVQNYSTASGTKLDQWTCKGASGLNQLWTLQSLTNGSSMIVSALSHLCVDDPGSSTASGVQLDQKSCVNGAPNQSWEFTAVGSPQPVPVNGACSSSNGVAVSSPPVSNLCGAGTASPISGSGPWTWSCAGANGGTTASCSAPLQQSGGGGGGGSGGGGSTSAIPSGWPSTFAIGLGVWNGNSQFPYLQQSGMPKWGAVYGYLSGGINSGWQTWGSGFVANFVKSARAGGSLPMFTYYMLVGSPPNPNDGQPQTDLNTASTMSAYFADFTALMKQLAAVGGPVVVQVEPDLWGYLEPGGLNASVSVVTSGNKDVASYPNTVAGFGHALTHLRDLYASNVILAATVSAWSWNTSTNCSLNVASIAQNDAAFMSGSGTWDLYFTDIAYGDAGGPNGTWWDAGNTSCPNFSVLNKWASAFTTATGKRLVLWQTPVGNTAYRTDNNAAWHYQDNRVQYWLQGYPGDGHLAALANAGVIGVVFDGGEPNPTTIFDAANDGVTNPAAINGNSTMSTVAADDGGLLI